MLSCRNGAPDNFVAEGGDKSIGALRSTQKLRVKAAIGAMTAAVRYMNINASHNGQNRRLAEHELGGTHQGAFRQYLNRIDALGELADIVQIDAHFHLVALIIDLAGSGSLQLASTVIAYTGILILEDIAVRIGYDHKNADRTFLCKIIGPESQSGEYSDCR